MAAKDEKGCRNAAVKAWPVMFQNWLLEFELEIILLYFVHNTS